jgi:predicted nuclease of restriction endonuclease-like (RecB) superfamily
MEHYKSKIPIKGNTTKVKYKLEGTTQRKKVRGNSTKIKYKLEGTVQRKNTN